MKRKSKNKPVEYIKPEPPQTDEQLIQQLGMAQRFLRIAENCVRERRHETAYVMTDRSNALIDQVQKAMEDMEP